MTVKKNVLTLGCALLIATPALAQQASVVTSSGRSAAEIGGIQLSVETLVQTIDKLEDLIEQQQQDNQVTIDALNDKISELENELSAVQTTVQDVSNTLTADECSLIPDPDGDQDDFIEDCEYDDTTIRNGDAVNLATKNVTLFNKNINLRRTATFTSPWLDTSGDIHRVGSAYRFPESNCQGSQSKGVSAAFSIHNISSSSFTTVDSFSFSHPRSREHGCKSFNNTGNYRISAQRSSDKKKVRVRVEVTSSGDFSGYYVGLFSNNLVISSTQTEIKKVGE